MAPRIIFDFEGERLELKPVAAPTVKPSWQDPACPKCGIILGNKMMYCCPHTHCPVGLN